MPSSGLYSPYCCSSTFTTVKLTTNKPIQTSTHQMASKISILYAAALCFVPMIGALTVPFGPDNLPITVDTEVTTTITAPTTTITSTTSDATSNAVISTVTITTTAPDTFISTTQLPWSNLDSSQIMSAYNSVASSVNDDCMASVSSLMTSAQDRNNQYYYYANWYISSNAARTGSATSGVVVTVTV